jgi:hypothetical protein
VVVRRDRQTNVTGVSRHLCIYSRPIRALRLLSIGLVIIASASVYAQRPELLDPRVSQTTITNTICEPAYLEKVIPPLNSRLQWKDYLLRERGVDPKTAWQYTFDFRVPVLLGGRPTEHANFDIVQWEGRSGARRKRRLTVLLKRCVCSGEIPLTRAQQVISGDWAKELPKLWGLACRDF